MKLKILSLLIAVLMSTAVLTACNKAPAGAESSGGSGESLSTAQGGEPSASESGGESGTLYEFAASEEAAAQVRSMAEVLGGYNFDDLSDIRSTWLLEQAIYADIAAAGDEISGYNGCKISAAALSALLESRFGVKYSGDDKEIFYDKYAKPWAAKSVRLESVSGESATYSAELESEYFDSPCRCKMVFAAEKQGEKYALRLVSNRFEAELAAPSPEQQAQYLTECLVGIMSADAAENGAAPEDFSPQAFIISVAATSFEERGFDPKTPYHRVFYMSPDGLWRFPAEEARRVVHEVFGTDFSGFDGCYDFAYDGAADEYVSGLEFGGESAYSCRSISVAAADGGYSVSFELASSAAFEGAAAYGKYTARFAAEKENGREFLRFEGITPANS